MSQLAWIALQKAHTWFSHKNLEILTNSPSNGSAPLGFVLRDRDLPRPRCLGLSSMKQQKEMNEICLARIANMLGWLMRNKTPHSVGKVRIFSWVNFFVYFSYVNESKFRHGKPLWTWIAKVSMLADWGGRLRFGGRFCMGFALLFRGKILNNSKNIFWRKKVGLQACEFFKEICWKMKEPSRSTLV